MRPPSVVTRETLQAIEGGEERRRWLTWLLVGITIVTVVVVVFARGYDDTSPSDVPEATTAKVVSDDSGLVPNRMEAVGTNKGEGDQALYSRISHSEARRRSRRFPEVAPAAGTRHSSKGRRAVRRKSTRRAAQPLRVKKQ